MHSDGQTRRFPAWTLVITTGVVVLNLELFFPSPARSTSVLALLQFDGVAVRSGEICRFLTMNLVHFNANHFLLDVGVFVVLGFLYERSFAKSYPWLLLTMAIAASIGGLLIWPERMFCRGLSAVDSGLFAA